ncbi:MAG: molybdenum cofactor guanylyltransferase [Chloroflexota bacterium]
MTRHNVTGVVLAGGRSSRMGTNKALLRFEDGHTVIERIVAALRPLCADLLLVTNTPRDYAFLQLPMQGDLYPGASSLGGICTGLTHATQPRILALSCDLPLVRGDVLDYLLELPAEVDLVMPNVDGRKQPLHAVYAKSCLQPMRDQIAAGDLKIVRLLDHLRGRIVDEAELNAIDPKHLSFRNMNTPADWAEIQRLGTE